MSWYRQSGIYAIIFTHPVTNEESIYVGQAKQFGRRWRGHRSLLNRSKHYNGCMQDTWSKFGSDFFRFSIQEVFDNPEEDFLPHERRYWDKFNEQGFYMFNLRPGDGVKGHTHSEETRDSMSRTTKEQWSNGEITGMKGRTQSEEAKERLRKASSGRRHRPESIAKMGVVQRKTRSFTSPSGEVVSTDNLYEFCDTNKLIYDSMRKMHCGRLKRHRRWTPAPNTNQE